MRTKVVCSLLKKEFLNIIRDRKSFIIMILLPLLMFPLMIGLMSIVLTSFTNIEETIEFGVNYQISDDFKNYVDNYSEDYQIDIVYKDEETLKEMFDNEEISVYVINNGNDYEIHYDENNTGVLATGILVEEIYNGYKEEYIKELLGNLNVNYEEIKSSFNVTFVQESITEMGSLIPSIISMVLVMIISSVCFSVSIDVTTSEKEKGTLETLLSLPIKKSELITSKFITVFILSAMSGFLTYISLFITIYFAGNTLAMMGMSSLAISPSTLLIYFIAIILISLLFSGILLSITIFSKNLKEAQNSLYPMELFVTFISMLPMFGLNASLKNAIIPFVNISLLFNNALASNIDMMFVVLTFGSTIVYAIIMIWVASKLYNQEDVLFNTKSLANISFVNGKSRSTNFGVFASIFLAVVIYLLAMYFSILFINSPIYLLMAIMPITIGLVVLIAGLIIKLDFIKSFKLNKFKMSHFMKSLLLYLGTYVIANVIMNIICEFFPSIVEDYGAIESLMNLDNVGLSILVIALLPAVFEEFLFRGVIFNSFNKKYGALIGVVISALFFGIYHMNWVQGIFAFVLGVMLAYVYLKTNSLFAPIILHFINNLYAVLVNHYEFLNFTLSIPMTILIIIVAITFIIAAIYFFETNRD